MIIYFNDNKQWLEFHIWTHSLKEFMEVNDAYAYYVNEVSRYKTKGCFGHIHLGEVTHELVAHELVHFQADYLNSRGGISEEKMAMLVGDITGKFWREYG